MDTREAVEFAGVQAALVAAGLHVVSGLPRAIVYLRVGRFPDPRPFLFVASGLGVFLAVTHLYYADPGARGRRRVHGFLLLVLVGYLLGYAAWHLGGHPIFSFGGGPIVSSETHPGNPVSILFAHLANDPRALVNAVVEVVGIVALGWLLAVDR